MRSEPSILDNGKAFFRYIIYLHIPNETLSDSYCKNGDIEAADHDEAVRKTAEMAMGYMQDTLKAEISRLQTILEEITDSEVSCNIPQSD